LKKILTITLITAILGFFGYFGYEIYSLFSWIENGCGFDDGPFKAVLIDKNETSDSVKIFQLENGQLILENRSDTLSPLLSLMENEKLIWTLDTDVRNTTGFESCRIWEISKIKIINGSNPIKLQFLGHWTYGIEHGSMEIDRKSGDNSFCLSW